MATEIDLNPIHNDYIKLFEYTCLCVQGNLACRLAPASLSSHGLIKISKSLPQVLILLKP